MKVKVLKTFKDKYSGKIHKANDTLCVTKARFDEINKKDKLVEEVKAPAKEAAKETTKNTAE